ncbi:glycosyltransferase 87 family protein [Xanthomonas graminis]|uniref:DUF2029 domain-containing protein n=1 Tax=Xanthomonas graminis pv. phlei TaxID=487906 RepID=A0A0K2ZSA5_9XANT|nr:glycosyltransferase 87 family protein [Xanthomonas translucens]CTP88493.1 hypothetical protein XTPLMG730_2158 [Xanthomonas translucens pv. phlei]
MSAASAAAPRPQRRQRLLRALDRRFAFHRRGNVIAAGLAVALLGGLLSLLLGQDANWDLRNYHLYNGYAALHGRLGVDLAPAQLQSYFNPLLDVLHYALMSGLPAPLAGFAMGALHALAFLLLAGIAWQVLDPRLDRARLAPWLALAGMCSAAFLSEFAGTMADNSSALPVLGALLAALHAQRRQQAAGQGVAVAWWALAGALLGLALACKLTNALFALALGVAALAAGGRARQRIGGAAVLSVVTVLGFAVLAGPWLLGVWKAFGNPLFPQFNSHFLAPLAQPVALSDTRWLPQGWLQWLSWPLHFSLAPNRVGEVGLRQIVWPLLYLVGLASLLRFALRRPRRPAAASDVVAPAWRALLVFFVVAYLAWQAVFSIQRYLVVPELLAPLLLWVGLRWLLPARIAAPAARWTLIGCALDADRLRAGRRARPGRLGPRALGARGVPGTGAAIAAAGAQPGAAGRRRAAVVAHPVPAGAGGVCVRGVQFPRIAGLCRARAGAAGRARPGLCAAAGDGGPQRRALAAAQCAGRAAGPGPWAGLPADAGPGASAGARGAGRAGWPLPVDDAAGTGHRHRRRRPRGAGLGRPATGRLRPGLAAGDVRGLRILGRAGALPVPVVPGEPALTAARGQGST